MATNWTLSQALAKITEGTDKVAIQDIGRRFPLTAVALAEIGQNVGAAKIIGAVPSHITARKIESVLRMELPIRMLMKRLMMMQLMKRKLRNQ